MSYTLGVGSTVSITYAVVNPGNNSLITGPSGTVLEMDDKSVTVNSSGSTVFVPFSAIARMDVSADGTPPSSSVNVAITSLPDRLTSDA